MGTGTSRQKLGQRVIAAQQQLEADKTQQSERAQQLKAASPETLDGVVQSIGESFERCSAFSEAALLVAFEANPEEVQRIMSKSCKKVLSAPIDKAEYAWFMRHVFPSTVWMRRTKDGSFLFQHMMAITTGMTQKIDTSMRSIFEHLQAHKEWPNVLAIKEWPTRTTGS